MKMTKPKNPTSATQTADEQAQQDAEDLQQHGFETGLCLRERVQLALVSRLSRQGSGEDRAQRRWNHRKQTKIMKCLQRKSEQEA